MAAASLQYELKKCRPFEHASQEAYVNVLRTASWLSGDFHALFKRHGLSETTYNVLRILRGARKVERLPGLPCLEVADRLITRVPDITRLVNRLIDAGLVTRTRDAADRRVALVSITDAGLRLLKKLDQPVVELHERQLGHLDEVELDELNRLLEKARGSAAEPEG
jgi:DNA-binding MarR family transcriptional regulator